MRLLLAVFFVAVSSAAGAANLQGSTVASGVPAPGSVNCQRTTGYLADQNGLYRGQPLKPRKLTELPPAIGYMAVYRMIGGCESPLTMVDYRNLRRR